MQTIGERLEEARKRKGISIREAAEATRIRGDYLHKFESNQFDINLPEIYVRGFLRTYAGYLKLPVDKISADYNALGLGQPKPKGLNREIYGRMELSVASSKDPGAAPEPAAPGSAAQQPAADQGPRNPATFVPPRSSGPQIDRDLIIKGAGLVVGAIVLIAIIVWGVSALTSSDRSPAPSTTKSGNENRVVTLVALDAIEVRVVSRNPDGTDGATIFAGKLARGQSQVIPWPNAIYIWASALENLEIEYQGLRHPTEHSGAGRIQI